MTKKKVVLLDFMQGLLYSGLYMYMYCNFTIKLVDMGKTERILLKLHEHIEIEIAQWTDAHDKLRLSE